MSNGYLVFIPDVVFRKGEPGASSYDAVVSGVKSLIDRYDFIDKDRIALNGHSWGGYQIAFLVTRTNMFKAAVSGAPVVNMTSAYGGIRWESGKSRCFNMNKLRAGLEELYGISRQSLSGILPVFSSSGTDSCFDYAQ